MPTTSNSKTTVPLAVIGCGIVVLKHHWPALQQLGRKFRVTVACNHTEPKARAFGEMAGARWCTDWREAIAAEDVDAVLVALPVELNLPVATAALKAGKHVLLEKPLACSMKECRALVRAASSSDRVAMLAENFRYRPALRKLKALLDSGKLGPIHAAQWTIHAEVTPASSPYARTAWRINHQYPGGFVMDAGVHYAHAVRWLFGEPTTVRGASRTINPAIGSVDHHTMTFETERGVAGWLSLSFSTPGLLMNRLVIVGSKATATLDWSRLTVHPRGSEARVLDIDDAGGYREQLAAFHASITRDAPVEATFEEGMKDFGLIERSLKSAGR